MARIKWSPPVPSPSLPTSTPADGQAVAADKPAHGSEGDSSPLRSVAITATDNAPAERGIASAGATEVATLPPATHHHPEKQP
jgi:hypothetical protein